MEQENKQVHMIKEEQIREALDENNRAKLVKGQTRSEKRKPDQGSWLSWMLERDGFIVDDEEESVKSLTSSRIVLTCEKDIKPAEALNDKGHKEMFGTENLQSVAAGVQAGLVPSLEPNLLHLPFFRHGKDPLEDFDYNDPRCNPLLRPAAAITPSIYHCTPTPGRFFITLYCFKLLTADCDDIIADVIIADPSTDSADVTTADPYCCLLILLTSSSP
ncbi:tyrosine-protein kinase Lck-like [Dorcoceras hygrometricum]|uniref:Tyrosine-protein kinase Lck-like n=1 Tax=Dorcoceras hygrometricum TaxID=472368 RepID=A0A2Z7D2Q6_9LAMI|nr:tyrosine-protein kinase Lck-like [Dorcoceras hygrometricum]